MRGPVDLLAVPRSLLERLGARGPGKGALLQVAGIEESRLDAQRGVLRVTTREFFALFRAVEALREDERDLGLQLGAAATADDTSLAMVAALRAATFGDALKKIRRYKRISCPEHVIVDCEHGEASVRCLWLLADTAQPRLLVDATFATFATLARRGTGAGVTPRRVELTRRSSDAKLLESYFECEIRFGAPIDRLVFDERALALPFVTSDARALATLIPTLEEQLARGAGARAFDDEVRLAIAGQMCGEKPTAERVARALHVSLRTMQRRLGEAGTSYQQQLDLVRQQTARRLLAHSDLEAVEVGFFLGFEEPSSFVRAFRSWEGTTPIRFRETA